MLVDFSRCPYSPWAHQRVGIEALINNKGFALFDAVGLGKSLQTTAAICHCYEQGEIDAAVFVTPGFARSVWASKDPMLGELVKHLWPGIPFDITEYCVRNDRLPKPSRERRLEVVVTGYEFIRRVEDNIDPKTGKVKREKRWPRLEPLAEWAAARKTWLVLDESWAVQNPQADQAKACYKLRQACRRVTLLNGTPGTPDKLFTQFQILDPSVLGCANWFQFRARYCVMGGYLNKKIVGFKNQDDFERRTKPYAIRRDSGLDIPPVLPPMTIEAQLTDAEWAVYKSMRDELVAWFADGSAAVAQQAGTRVLRLSQILAGFVGGLEGADDLLSSGPTPAVREVGRAKLRAVLDFLTATDLNRVVLWCRFRPEMHRLAETLRGLDREVHLLMGQQPADERDAAKRAFAPGSDAPRGACLVGHPAAGGAGLNFAAASTAIYVTNPWSWKDRKQSEGRINRPGQTSPVRFVDVVAVGPAGQKTVDHSILRALREHDDIANWTADTWRHALTAE